MKLGVPSITRVLKEPFCTFKVISAKLVKSPGPEPPGTWHPGVAQLASMIGLIVELNFTLSQILLVTGSRAGSGPTSLLQELTKRREPKLKAISRHGFINRTKKSEAKIHEKNE